MTPKPLPTLSPAETEILKILWSFEGITVKGGNHTESEEKKPTVNEIKGRLPENRKIGYATVQTLLRRLEKKGYITHRPDGKTHLFRPAVSRKEVMRQIVNDFVTRLFDGDIVKLVEHVYGMAGSAEQARIRKALEPAGQHPDLFSSRSNVGE